MGETPAASPALGASDVCGKNSRIMGYCMGEFGKWLLHEDQKELFESLYATALILVFLGLSALVLWPMGKASMVYSLAAGYGVFWLVLSSTALLLALFQRVFRVDLYSHPDAYVISGLAVGGLLQAGWSAFAALTARGFALDASAWVAAALYVVGFLSCQVAFAEVSVYYGGHIYRFVNLPLTAAAFILFSLWPAAARALYGWFFDLFKESISLK